MNQKSLDKKKTKKLDWVDKICNEVVIRWSVEENMGGFDGIYSEFAKEVARKCLTQQRTELTCINQPRRYGKSTFVTDKFLAGCKNNEAVEYHQVGWIALSAKAYKNRLEKVRTELLEEIKKLPDLTTTEFGEETISRLEVINLLNKKDEQT